MINAAGIDVSGHRNPNWRGGKIEKICSVCASPYQVKKANKSSRFCSLKCVGVSQRGSSGKAHKHSINCEVCGKIFHVPRSHAHRYHCCSRACSNTRRANLNIGAGNPNWSGGLSRMPYPWNFRTISKSIIQRDGNKCQNPDCSGKDERLTTHHINYDKSDCSESNLICLCSTCNTKANFGRDEWQEFYSNIIAVTKRAQKHGGGFAEECFS